MSEKFGLFDGINKRAREMLSSDADVRSLDTNNNETSSRSIRKPFGSKEQTIERNEAPKDDMRKYWRQFETTPILRKPITSFASQVVEPGYYVEAKGLEQSEVDELVSWLESCAVIEGMPNRDWRLLAKKSVVQQEVRGIALVEKAPDKNDSSKLAGLKLINPETMEAITRPGQSILLEPDDLERFDDDEEEIPVAESGGAAAWVQDLSKGTAPYSRNVRKPDKNKIGFRRDEIITMPRDADVGEIFGTSRIEAVSDRIDGLKQKLCDNDEAIESKAYPLWLFKFGSEDNPWDASYINKFMSAHEMENFTPGMKQGVRGDVDVDTVSGEVADIAEYLRFDVQWIMSVMPMPMFALGAFSDGVGQIGGIAQQQDVNRQIKEARRELEDEFTPVLREVARQKGFDPDSVEGIRLHIGKPGEPDFPQNRNEQIIRYVSGDDDDDDDSSPNPTDNPAEPNTPVPSDGNPFADITMPSSENAKDSRGAQVWYSGGNVAELEFTNSKRNDIADVVNESLVYARDEALDAVEKEYSTSSQSAVVKFEGIANSVMNKAVSQKDISSLIKPTIQDAVTDTIAEYGSEHTTPFTTKQSTEFFVQNIVNSTDDALDEMSRRIRTQVRRGAIGGEDFDDVRERTKDEFNDAGLRAHAELIAHMELKKAVETTKLHTFEANPDIIGVRVSNSSKNTPLTQSLDGAEAYFDDGDIDAQFSNQTKNEFMHEGFKPLPSTPPFHFQDKSVLEPIYKEEDE